MKISLEDDDPDSIYRMLSYLYTQDYDDGSPDPDSVPWLDPGTWQRTSEEAASAPTNISVDDSSTNSSPSIDYHYSHPPEVITHADGTLQSVRANVQVFIIADKYNLQELETHATSKLHRALANKWHPRDLALLTQEIYNLTPSPRPLRDAIMNRNGLESTVLIQDQSWIDLIREGGDIAVDLFFEFMKEHRHPRHLIMGYDWKRGDPLLVRD